MKTSIVGDHFDKTIVKCVHIMCHRRRHCSFVCTILKLKSLDTCCKLKLRICSLQCLQTIQSQTLKKINWNRTLQNFPPNTEVIIFPCVQLCVYLWITNKRANVSTIDVHYCAIRWRHFTRIIVFTLTLG